MEDSQKLDLDAIQPESAKVKLNGQWYTLEQPKLGTIVKLTKLAKLVENPNDEQASLEALDMMNKVIGEMMPDLEGNKVDLTMQQVGAVLGLIFEMASPPDLKAVRQKGLEPVVDEKKSPDSVS